MKKRIIIILIVLLLIVGVGSFIFIKSKDLKVVFKKNIKIEINEKVYNIDYVKRIKNGKVKSKKKLIDTTKLGKRKVNIVITNYFNHDKSFEYYVTIVDTKKPVIEFKKEIVVTLGDEVDLLKDVKVSDNSLEELKASVSGDYDLKKVGNYKLKYKVKDKSGNEALEEFTLVVKDKPKEDKKVVINNPDSTFTTSKGFKGYTKNGLTYIDGYLIANKTYSLPSSYNPGLDGTTLKQANIMFADAKKEGLNIYLSSGFRSYSTQRTLYNNYVARDGQAAADTYSARPGYSEHQTGLAFDVNQINSSFDNSNEAKWLSSNCHKYGFILRYPKGKTGETGYQYESWHFRYVGTLLAGKLYNGGNWITLEDYFGITSKYN